MNPSNDRLIVPRRFCGPPSSGNGGWTAGALAATIPLDAGRGHAWPAVTVALRQPPPLDVALPLTDDGGARVATYDGRPVAQARRAERDLEPVGPVPADEARGAEATYPGLRSHPFPTCFACGTEREEGDGLRIFPGEVTPEDGQARAAGTWRPHPSHAEDWHEYRDDVPHASLPVTWAALDCVGAWAADMADRPMVLGTMTARVDALPAIDEEHVVVGAARGQEGRKTFTASTLYDADGRVVACAEHVWITIEPAAFA
ncbi:hypothetical protein LRP67_05895 [Nocardioides sp. cx-169]|uniref:hypothetical protein n=1 Tax=Nocardioides sp. cx-169 TaxID=2899080 RepID=UPI001E3C57BE|nr:hypothetical protein [Nocardioides sp. cx-169]MCD4533609.1 hypothetical protein [Nocardioides sp. cx-169]